jgi:hypothetical protein
VTSSREPEKKRDRVLRLSPGGSLTIWTKDLEQGLINLEQVLAYSQETKDKEAGAY